MKTTTQKELEKGKFCNMRLKDHNKNFDGWECDVYTIGTGREQINAYVVTDEKQLIEKLRLEYIGAVSVPEGLKAAAAMGRRIDDNSAVFGFSFDGVGRWAASYDIEREMNYINGSDAAPACDMVLCDSFTSKKAAFHLLEKFDHLEVFLQGSKIVYKVATLDDGRAVFGVMTWKMENPTTDKVEDFKNSFELSRRIEAKAA